MRVAALLSAAVATFFATGCATDRWYNDPVNPSIRYEDLAPAAQAARFRVEVVLRAEGYRHPSRNLQGNLHKQVMAVLDRTGLVEVSRSLDDPILCFTLETEPEDASEFERRGPGAHIKWIQELTVESETAQGPSEQRYSQSILIYRGKSQEPANLTTPMRPQALHDQVVESLLLHALRDLQREGVLPGTAAEQP
jgi:hypothetical protein